MPSCEKRGSIAAGRKSLAQRLIGLGAAGHELAGNDADHVVSLEHRVAARIGVDQMAAGIQQEDAG